jgi:hypothetical protein
MRFWIKLAGLGVFGYLLMCLFPLPSDYSRVVRADSIFEQIASNADRELWATGHLSAESKALFEQASDQRSLAFAQWSDDLKRLGMG